MSQKKNTEKIKLKIRALLQKTTDNGATEAEALSALQKATDLMKELDLSISDIEDPYLGEEPILKTVQIAKVGYEIGYFYRELADLFDCEHFFTKYHISFFGFPEDVELCVYFYRLITDSLSRSMKEFKKSERYKELTKYQHGRAVMSVYSKGYVVRIALKMQEMYKNRKGTVPTSEAIVLSSKMDRVKFAFCEKHNPRQVQQKPIKGSKEAYDEGVSAGDKLHLTQGVKDGRSDLTKKLPS